MRSRSVDHQCNASLTWCGSLGPVRFAPSPGFRRLDLVISEGVTSRGEVDQEDSPLETLIPLGLHHRRVSITLAPLPPMSDSTVPQTEYEDVTLATR